MSVNVAINGFGRIGRNILRIASQSNDFNVVAVNDLTDAKTLAHLFKYDSVHGIFSGQVDTDGENLLVNDQSTKILSQRDPSQLPWKELEVDIVIESTGFFRTRDLAAQHLTAGAKRS